MQLIRAEYSKPNKDAGLKRIEDIVKQCLSIIVFNREVRVEKPELPIKITGKTTSEEKSTDVKISVSFYYCREDNQGACFIDAVVCHQPIKLDKESANTAVTMDYLVKLP